MATITQRGDKWRVQIRLKGRSKSATFERYADAKAWAARTESQIMDGLQRNTARNTTVRDIINRYITDVTPSKRGNRSEAIRLARIARTKLGDIQLSDITPQDVADWRDFRLTEVQPISVNRELSSLSSVFEQATKEWAVIAENPVKRIGRPKGKTERTRRPTEQEVNDICAALLYKESVRPELVSQRAAIALLFAIETAMRAGEICGLKWADINLERRLAHLSKTKNGHSRDVPLSMRAVELLQELKGIDDDSVFLLTDKTLDVLFRRARDKCGILDLHFHDSRREALTRMAKKVPVEMLAKISGHRDMSILLNVYYRPDMAEVASLLD